MKPTLSGPQPAQFIQEKVAKDKIAWQPWSDAAFAKAKKEKRFILMDLEAVWCHWCHVMEEKTYSDPGVIALIQSNFIPVRVDQDSRPDLASKYGEYGWPATIIFDGTGKEITKQRGYIDPASMKEMLAVIIKNPSDPDLLDENARRKISESKSDFLSPEQKAELQKIHLSYYDFKKGGWGFKHKFITQTCVDYAIVHSQEDKQSKKMATQTLKELSNLVDPVWGGVYQYSTDGDWKHPHYEKIMSMQTQAIQAYAHGYAAFKTQLYKDMAEKIYQYMKGFLMSPDGAFYTSQDADVVQGEHAEEFFAMKDQLRRKKGMPRIDKNVYSRENGWAIDAFTTLYGVTGDEEKIKEALRAAIWIVQNRSTLNGGYRHDSQDKGAYLGDTLAMGSALLNLYTHTGNWRWLKLAQQAASYIDQKFTNPDQKRGGYISSTNKIAGQALAPNQKENVEMARFGNLLYHYTGNMKYKAMAKQAMRYLVIPEVYENTLTAGTLLADAELSQDPVHITVVGSKSDEKARILFKTALSLPLIYRRIEWKDPADKNFPISDVQYPELGQAAAFLCTQQTCSSPIFDAEDLKKRIN